MLGHEPTEKVDYLRVLSRLSIASCIVLVLATPARALADDVVPESRLPATLSLEQALGAFRTNGLDLLIADAAVQSAEGSVRAADAIPNPSLSATYGFSYYPGSTTKAPPYVAIGVTDQAAIEDTLSGKRGLRNDVAEAALRAARLGRTDAERTLAFAVKAQFEQVLLAQSALRFARDTANANAIMLDKAQKQRDADKIQRPDLLRVKVAKLESDQAVDQADQNLRKARAQLAFLLGVRSANPEFVAVEPELEHFSLPQTLASASHDSLLEQAFKARPDLAAQEAQVASADANLRLANRLRFPDITLSLGYAQQGTSPSDPSPPTFSIGLSAPIPVLYQQQGEIQMANANLRTQQLQVAKLRATVRAQFDAAYADFVASRGARPAHGDRRATRERTSGQGRHPTALREGRRAARRLPRRARDVHFDVPRVPQRCRRLLDLGVRARAGDRQGVAMRVVLIALACVAACGGASGAREVQPDDEVWLSPQQMVKAAIRVAEAKAQPLAQGITVAGHVAFDDLHATHVFSPVTGRVTRVLAKPGDRVVKGAPLVAILSPDVGTAFSDTVKAQADLQASQLDYEREQRLFARTRPRSARSKPRRTHIAARRRSTSARSNAHRCCAPAGSTW